MDAVQLGQQALAISLIVKATVDIYRKLPIPSPSWALLLAAFLFGLVGGIGMTYANATTLNGPLIVRGVIIGFLGFAGAVATTELHNKAREGE